MRRRRHPLSGAMYVVGDDGFVHVDLGDKHGVFTADGDWVSGELHQADPHLCGWLAGRQLPTGFAGNPKDLPAAAAQATTPSTPDAGNGDVVRHG
jgi:hypothetical protein